MGLGHVTHTAASEVADIIDSNWPTRQPSQQGEPLNKDARSCAETAIIDFAAHLIASLIDAGSEREVIYEDEKFRRAVEDLLKEW